MTNVGYDTEWLDGKVMVIAKLLQGADLLKRIDGIPSLMRWRKGGGKERLRPVVDVTITDAGQLPLAEPFAVTKDPVPFKEPYTEVSIDLHNTPSSWWIECAFTHKDTLFPVSFMEPYTEVNILSKR